MTPTDLVAYAALGTGSGDIVHPGTTRYFKANRGQPIRSGPEGEMQARLRAKEDAG